MTTTALRAGTQQLHNSNPNPKVYRSLAKYLRPSLTNSRIDAYNARSIQLI